MTLKEAKTIISKISYKPEWCINAFDGDFGGLEIVILSEPKPDATQKVNYTAPTSRPAHIACYELDNMTRNDLLLFIKRGLVSHELHELDEWLKYDSAWLVHPHPEMGQDHPNHYPYEVVNVS